MNIGKLNEKCPKCGSEDKTIKRKFNEEFQAHATTKSVLCSQCGYVFVTGEEKKDKH